MKTRPILAALMLLITTHLAQARIGETFDQCVQRYGEPLAPPKAGEFVTFVKSGIAIAVFFFEGRAERILFTKPDHERLSDTEIGMLMNANAGGHPWKKISALDAGSLNPTWATEDMDLFAQRELVDGSLLIATKAALARVSAEKSAGEAKKLTGF